MDGFDGWFRWILSMDTFDRFDIFFTKHFMKFFLRTSAVSSTNFRSILIFASCIVGNIYLMSVFFLTKKRTCQLTVVLFSPQPNVVLTFQNFSKCPEWWHCISKCHSQDFPNFPDFPDFFLRSRLRNYTSFKGINVTFGKDAPVYHVYPVSRTISG